MHHSARIPDDAAARLALHDYKVTLGITQASLLEYDSNTVEERDIIELFVSTTFEGFAVRHTTYLQRHPQHKSRLQRHF